MQGYLTMCAEAVENMTQKDIGPPTHVFLQAGVGSLAGAMIGYLVNYFQEEPPSLIIVEPDNAACIFVSAQAGDGKPHHIGGSLNTIMAGLACGEPNPIAWDIIRDFSRCFISCDDSVAANGIRILNNPLGEDPVIETGESGAVGIGVMDLLVNKDDPSELKHRLSIGSDSRLLFFNTEGATDPENIRQILWYGKYST